MDTNPLYEELLAENLILKSRLEGYESDIATIKSVITAAIKMLKIDTTQPKEKLKKQLLRSIPGIVSDLAFGTLDTSAFQALIPLYEKYGKAENS